MVTAIFRLKVFWTTILFMVVVGGGWLVLVDEPIALRYGFFIFSIAAILWVFELIPLYATSLLVVVLSTFLLAPVSGKPFEYIALFANPIIFLFFGGFVLAAALHKHQVDEWMVSELIKIFGRKPFLVLLGLVFATGILSFWMSNTATTAVMLVTAAPLLKSFDVQDPFRKAVALSIPFAANIGGIATPIATPPNAIVVSLLAEKGIHIHFLKWMMMAVPLVLVLLVFLTVILFLLFPSRTKMLQLNLKKRPAANIRTYCVIAIALLTIILWLSSGWHHMNESHIAVLSVTLFAITGLITKEDIQNIDWDILILMWGGLALGKAIEVSGLAKWVVMFPALNQSGFFQVAIFTLLTVITSVFMSNTAAANLILPLALSVGGEQMALLGIMVALSSSFDMILPISTPPNAMAFATREFSSVDMLKVGLIVIVPAILFLLIGYPFFIGKILLG